MSYRVHFSPRSQNAKTGPIPVSTTESATCPPSCGMFAACYAKTGPVALHWRRIDAGQARANWGVFLAQVAALPAGQLWRHNQAGDLPGVGERIDAPALRAIVDANAAAGARGFTFTHKPVAGAEHADNARAILDANRRGFAVNLSADSLAEADALHRLRIAPVVAVLPLDAPAKGRTPGGVPYVACPAQVREGVTCATCGLCALQHRRRPIIGFYAHGTAKRRADARARQGTPIPAAVTD